MESPRTSTPSTLSIDAHHQSSRFQGIPDHLEAVEKVNNYAQQLTTAFNQLLETTKWDIDRARQETKLIEERLQDSESEKAELLQRLREIEGKYKALEDVVMEKDEEIQQNWKALQLAEEENIKLEYGRGLAISVMTETQYNAAISEALANERAEKALQSEAASHYRAEKLQEERNLAVNARDAAECRAEDAEKAKILAEERAKGLESNQAYMLSLRQQAEIQAEKAQWRGAMKPEGCWSEQRITAFLISRDKEERVPGPEATYHDQRLEDLAENLNRVVKDWGTEKERHALFTFTNDSITVARVRRGRDTCESSLRVRCVRHHKEPVIIVFSVISIARAIYGADLDSKAAEELLRAYISQKVSRRHAQNLDVGEETERVILFRWANLVDILNEIARVYHKPVLAAGTV
ncbi:unnamed protein product, partial [Clonostachys rhizophaga]